MRSSRVRKTIVSLAWPAFLLLFCTSISVHRMFAQDAEAGPVIISSDHFDTSPAVRDMLPVEFIPGTRHIMPLHRKPGPPIVSAEPDSITQESVQALGRRVGTTNLLNFDGISDRDGIVPPDTNASVGSTQVVETVNTSYQVFNKTNGASIFGPAEVSAIFSGFGGVCQTGPDYTDPVVLYDKLADRWLITIVASSNGFATGSQCVAVSTTSDATLSYHRYAFSFGKNFGDYPKFGVWPDAYYASYNVFGPTAYLYAQACAYDRANMLVGLAAKAHCFNKPKDFSLLPSDLDGAGLFTVGEPNFFVELDPVTSNQLDLFKFHVDFAVPTNSKFTGPTKISIAPYSQACGGGTCIPQTGTSTKLDSLADRMMFRLAYRAFSDHEALVVTHSVKPSGSLVSAARWYEIRSPNTTPAIFQQGTFSTTALDLWMGSIGTDKVGDIALGYSQSSSSTHPSIAYTGRVPGDPLGTMETPSVIKNGTGSQNGGVTRWGDYSSMSIDPVDDCTFWYAQEYLTTNGSFNWHTRLASFKFTTCH